MKTKITFIIILLTLTSHSLFSQQSKSNLFFSVGGGLSVPVMESGFTDTYSAGYIISGNGGYILDKNIAIRGSVHYTRFNAKTSTSVLEGYFTVFSLKGEIMFSNFRSKDELTPYGFAGTGIYSMSSTLKMVIFTTPFEVTASDTYLGVNAGGGVKYKMSTNVSLFAEADFNYVFNSGTAKLYLPITIGLNIVP